MIEEKSPLMVTILCITYNHKSYIRQCLEGFVMQKTNFRFEAIVHDDASTDGTVDIVREFAEKYPDIIKPMIEKENQYSKGKTSFGRTMLEHYPPGKYIAECEGDDYWTDPLKLQKQVDFMEANPECTLYVSNGMGYFEDKNRFVMLNSIPTKESKFLTMSEVLMEKGGLIPTASMCYRREMIETEPDWCLKAPVGDRPLRLWCAINGKVYYDVNPMVVYRKSSVGSFSQRVKKDYNYARHILDDMMVFFDTFDDYTHQEYHDDVQYMKDREDYYFYCRVGDLSSVYHSEYIKTYSMQTRILIKTKILLALNFPWLYNFVKRFKTLL